jgi:preprotein translocase subunit YajC
MSSYILIAQEPPAEPPAQKKPAPGPFGDPTFLFLMFGLMIVFLFILPARQQRRQQQELMASIKPGAKILTASGIIGTIVTLKDNEDEITLRSGETKLRVTKSSIARVLGQDEAEAPKA